MVTFHACLLLVACACLVPARSALEQKDVAQSGTDVHNGNRWPMTHPSFARDQRHLNAYARKGTNNTKNETHHRANNHSKDETQRGNASAERKGAKSGEGHEMKNHSQNETQREYKSTHAEKKGADVTEGHGMKNHSKHEMQHGSERTHDKMKGAESVGGRAEKGARGKDCGGGAATREGKKSRNLRALNEHEAEPESECNEEDDSLGLPIILGISGAALMGVSAFGTIAFVCSRRRIVTKSVPGSVGVVVVGQPVTESTPKDESNKHGNML